LNIKETSVMTDSTPKTARTRVQWTAVEKSEWVALFRKSGLTQGQFCRENDLAPATLAVWLKPPQEPKIAEEPEVVEVPRQLVTELVSVPTVTMQLPGGARLEIPAGTDPAWLAQFVRAFAPVIG
jgi:hypothetical protein